MPDARYEPLWVRPSRCGKAVACALLLVVTLALCAGSVLLPAAGVCDWGYGTGNLTCDSAVAPLYVAGAIGTLLGWVHVTARVSDLVLRSLLHVNLRGVPPSSPTTRCAFGLLGIVGGACLVAAVYVYRSSRDCQPPTPERPLPACCVFVYATGIASIGWSLALLCCG